MRPKLWEARTGGREAEESVSPSMKSFWVLLTLSASYSLTSWGGRKKCARKSQDLSPLAKVNPFAVILRTQI